MELRTIYKIDDGDTFEGTEEQLEDCFGVDDSNVLSFCEFNKMKLEMYERICPAFPTYKEIK